MTYDPDRPDFAVDPKIARRRRWAIRMIFPGAVLLILPMAVSLPLWLVLTCLFGAMFLGLGSCVLLLPWDQWRSHD